MTNPTIPAADVEAVAEAIYPELIREDHNTPDMAKAALTAALSLGYRRGGEVGWVSVDERKPDILKSTFYAGVASDEVATITPQGLQFMRWVWYEDNSEWMYCEQNGNMDRISKDSMPTHWMPLPQPPKVAGGDGG